MPKTMIVYAPDIEGLKQCISSRLPAIITKVEYHYEVGRIGDWLSFVIRVRDHAEFKVVCGWFSQYLYQFGNKYQQTFIVDYDGDFEQFNTAPPIESPVAKELINFIGDSLRNTQVNPGYLKTPVSLDPEKYAKHGTGYSGHPRNVS